MDWGLHLQECKIKQISDFQVNTNSAKYHQCCFSRCDVRFLCGCLQARVLHKPTQAEDCTQHLRGRPCTPPCVWGKSPRVSGQGRDHKGRGRGSRLGIGSQGGAKRGPSSKRYQRKCKGYILLKKMETLMYQRCQLEEYNKQYNLEKKMPYCKIIK